MGNRLDKKKEAAEEVEGSVTFVDMEDVEVEPAERTSSYIYNRKIKEIAAREMQRSKRKSAPAFFDSEDIQKLFGQVSESSRVPADTNRSNSTGLFYKNVDSNETFKFYRRSERSQEVLKNELFLRCKERLSRYYLNENVYMRSRVWEGRGYDFPLTRYLVPFCFESGDSCGRRKKEDARLEDFLEKSGRRTVLVTAGPGFGKSTLCAKLAHDWATGDCAYSKHFDMVITLRLCALGEKSVMEALVDAVLLESEKEVIAGAKQVDLDFLIILDGYDECRHRNAVRNFVATDSPHVSKKVTVLVTSRPHAAEELREYADECLSIKGFSKENQKRYVEFFDSALTGDNREHVDSLLLLLEKDQSLLGMAECPLLLHMLCCLHWELSICKMRRKTDLYVWLFSHMIYRYVRRKEGNSVMEIGEHFLGENSLIKLGKLAWNCLFSNQPLASSELYREFSDEDEREIILGLDILVYRNSTFEGREIAVFEPVHKSLFQFLSALYVSSDHRLTLDLSVKGIFDQNLFLFICGLMDEGGVSDAWLDYPLYDGFEASFLLNLRREMRSEVVWDTFCSKVHVKFSRDSDETLKKVLSGSKMENVFLTLPECWSEYRQVKNSVANTLGAFRGLKRLRVYLYAVVSGKYSLANCFSDIREQAAMMADFLQSAEAEDCEILVNGVNFFGMYFPFVSIWRGEDTSDAGKAPEAAENAVGLKIDQGNVFLISDLQFRALRSHINVRPGAEA